MYDAFSRMENLLGTKGVKRLGSAKSQCSALVVSVRMWWKLLHAVELEALHLLIMKIFL